MCCEKITILDWGEWHLSSGPTTSSVLLVCPDVFNISICSAMFCNRVCDILCNFNLKHCVLCCDTSRAS